MSTCRECVRKATGGNKGSHTCQPPLLPRNILTNLPELGELRASGDT